MAITGADLFEAPAPVAPAAAKPAPARPAAEKAPEAPPPMGRPAQLLASAWYDDERKGNPNIAFGETSPWYQKTIAGRMERCLRRLTDCGYTITHERQK